MNTIVDKIDNIIRNANASKKSSILFNILLPFFVSIIFSIICYTVGKSILNIKELEIQALTNVPVFLILLYIYLRTCKIVECEKIKINLKDLMYIIALGLSLSIFLNILITQIANIYNVKEDNLITNAVLDSNIYFALFLTCISAPLCEELVFRGYIFKTLNRFYGFWVPAIISSLIFAIVHFFLLGVIFAFLCGMFLAFVYHIYKSLIMCTILHMSINFFTLTLYYNEIVKLSVNQVLFAQFIAFALIIMITLRLHYIFQEKK